MNDPKSNDGLANKLLFAFVAILFAAFLGYALWIR